MAENLFNPEYWNELLWPILFNPINKLFAPDPRYVLTAVFVVFALVCWKIKYLTHPTLMLGLAVVSAILFAVGLVNPDFQLIMFKADNVPIVILLITVPFFTWWGLRQAVLNDEYKARAGSDLLKISNTVNNDPEEKLHTFPFLVHPEFIACIACAAFLTFWSVFLDAPLEQPSDPARTPNPSKAPWYFLGLQEMLVYFDPWMAGVVMPSYIVAGLIAIPYFDANKKGNGYYTWEERKWAIMSFLFGFVILWVVMIILGTILRGPGWNFFGPYQFWDPHKVEALTSVNLSEWIPLNIPGFSWMRPTTFWMIREGAGLTLIGFWFVVIPWLGWIKLKKLAEEMGPLRYIVATHMIMMMLLLPLKMYMRWFMNLKYIAWIPEIGVNL